MPVFLPAAVQSHQMICIDALLGLQTTVNKTVQRCHLAEDPQQLTAGLRGAVAVARSALPGDFAPSSEVAAAAFEKLGTRKLPSAPKLQKDVDTFSKLCKEGKELPGPPRRNRCLHGVPSPHRQGVAGLFTAVHPYPSVMSSLVGHTALYGRAKRRAPLGLANQRGERCEATARDARTPPRVAAPARRTW